MKKRSTALGLVGLMAVGVLSAGVLAGCTTKDTKVEEPTVVEEGVTTEDTTEDTEDLSDIDVSVDLDEEVVVKVLTVEEGEVLIKLPLEIQGAYSQAGLDRLIAEDTKILDGTLNEDRSITIKMTKESQMEISDSMLNGIKATVNGILEDKETYSYIEKIEIGEEVDAINILLNDAEYKIEDVDRLAFELGFSSVAYKAYAGKDINVKITVADSNGVVKEYDYPSELPKPELEKATELTEEEEKAIEEKAKEMNTDTEAPSTTEVEEVVIDGEETTEETTENNN